MQRKPVDLRSQHDLGAIVGYAYRIYLRHFAVLFALAILVVPVEMLGGVLIGPAKAVDNSWGANLFQLAAGAVAAVAVGAIVFAVNDVATSTPPSISRSLDAVFERIVALFGTLLLGAVLVAAALYLFPFVAIYWLFHRDATLDGRRQWWIVLIPLVLPIFLLIRWSLMLQAVMIDGKRNWSALDASAAVARGNWWRIVSTLLVLLLIGSGPILLAGAAILLPDLGYATVTGIALALVLPFHATAQTLLYYDLKARKQSVNNADGIAVTGPDVPRESP